MIICTARNFTMSIDNTNPYEYTETAESIVLPNNGEYPPTPFTLKLTYKDKPCLMTVERDHLVIEGVSLREPIRMLRYERYKLNSCFYYHHGYNRLIIWHRPTRKEYTFLIEERSMVDLKVSWLLAWKEGIPEERTPEEHIKKTSNKWLFGRPLGWLLFNAIGVGASIHMLVDDDVILPFWFAGFFTVIAIVTLAAFILMLCRIKEGILLATIAIFAVYIMGFVSVYELLQLLPFPNFSHFFGILLCGFTFRCCIISYIRAVQLDRQIHEKLTEYESGTLP